MTRFLRPLSQIIAVVLVLLCLVLAIIVAVSAGVDANRRESWTGGGEDTFPYWARSLDPPQKMFRALETNPAHTAGDSILIRTYPGDYRKADAISNHYTESARIDCRVSDFPTPREAWKSGQLDTDSLENQRESVYAKSRECNIFNPSFAKWIIEKTVGAGASILDPSSGWGDRLIGALAAKAKTYCGFDPNPRLQEGYRRIVDDFGSSNHEAFRVTEAPFESVDICDACGGCKFDLALTSPPYYSYEVYVPPGGEGESAQSIANARTYDEWVEQMYRPYITNAFNAVRPGGWLVFYVEDFSVGKKQYPLRQLTQSIMAGLGAESAGRFGLQVRTGGKKRRRAKTRWALAWRVPVS